MQGDAILDKPFLKWAGGKHKLSAIISEQLGKAQRLVEPFMGSGAVFMNTDFPSYFLCDTNKDLINLYKFVQSDHGKIIDIAQSLFTPQNNTKDAFYVLREEFNTRPDDARKSAIFIYLNRHAFNGLCRYNASGKFNVPFGRYTAPRLPRKEIISFAQKSALAEFHCLDFVQTFDHVKKGDVIYADPPYAPLEQTSNFTSYAKGEFGAAEQTLLMQHARKAQNAGIRVVLSNHDTPFTRELYAGAAITALSVRRNIAARSSTRGHADELIAVFAE